MKYISFFLFLILKILNFLAPNLRSSIYYSPKIWKIKSKVMFLFVLSELFCRLYDEIRQQFSWPRRWIFLLGKWIPNRTLCEKGTYLQAVCLLWLSNNVCNKIIFLYFGISSKENPIKIHVTMCSARRKNTRKRLLPPTRTSMNAYVITVEWNDVFSCNTHSGRQAFLQKMTMEEKIMFGSESLYDKLFGLKYAPILR
jgi:hypothetical protein